MKKILLALGLVAACAACCTVPLALPMLAAMLVSGSAWAFGCQMALGTGLLLGGAGILLWRYRRAQASSAACTPTTCCVPTQHTQS